MVKNTIKVLVASTVLSLGLFQSAKSEASPTGLYHAQSIFVDRGEIVYPIPSDSDVIKTFGIPTQMALSPNSIRFLIWNLHKGADKSFKYEYLALGYDRDIIMNQEIFLDKNMMDVFHFLPYFYFTTATSFFSGKEKTRTGVANISRVKPSFTKFVKTETLEPIVNSPKVALINSYPLTGSRKKLTVVNIHGINFVSNKNFRNEMSRLYEQIKDIPSPLVFSGDFNTWNKERIEILNEYAQRLGLEEATFTPDDRMTFNNYPLDHFLHTPDLKVTRARVDKIYEGSDHK
ncbi:MAG: endonuclease/exonuclease/phosphatase family protein, partial [Bdellovibrionales bacterium]|nr:endonuclease/exonuclease/phosphatase family protein [Bdellovibrionales bacterium]